MGAPAVGWKSYIQIGKETTWATPVAATIKLPILPGSNIELDAPPIVDNTLHGNPWERAHYRGPRKARGSFSTQLLFEGLLELFRGAFGSYSNAPVETGVRDHTFKIGTTLNGYTLQDLVGDIPAGKCFREPGAKISQLTIKGANGEIPSCEWGVIAKDKESNQTPTGSLSFPPLLPVRFDTTALATDDGTADAAADVRIRQFKIVLANSLADSRDYLSSLYVDEPVRAGHIVATWELMQEFQTLSQYDAFRNSTVGSPRIVLQDPVTIGAASKREFEIRSNQATLESVSIPQEGPGVLIATATWRAFFDGVDTAEASPIVARFRNTEAALA